NGPKTDDALTFNPDHSMGAVHLAPDIVRDVLEGRQPIGFTSEWCLRHDLPSDWTEQRQHLATL
ncbi:hypothetical protein XM53_08840, partial [Roseovarius atlanticus]